MNPKFLGGLDGYCQKLSLAFEYDGVQHERETVHFHKGPEDFAKPQKPAKRKNKLCLKNGVQLNPNPLQVRLQEPDPDGGVYSLDN
jgi:hypothetical protein